MHVAQEYGGVVKYRVAHLSFHLVTHPDGVQRILHDNHRNYTRSGSVIWDIVKTALGNSLLTSDGDFWLRRRRLMQPVFHHRHVADFGTIMTHETLARLNTWQPFADNGQPLDMTSEMMQLTLNILIASLFSADIEARANSILQATTVQNEDMNLRVTVPFYPPPSVPTPHNRRLREALRTLDQIIYSLIDAHRKHSDTVKDLLSLLMQARGEETGESMSDQELRDELLSLFFAGHETTANTLAWTFYLLAKHPDVARRLWAEIDMHLGKRIPMAADLPNLPYAQMIISEVLRLYPPAWITNKKAIADDEVCGYHIPAGSLVTLCSYVTHRHPDYWENPDRFDPERFSSERSQERPRYVYFPFLGGPHQCIGKDFALIEVQLILIMVAQRYGLELVPDYTVVPEPLITLRPRGSLPMTVHNR